jgi:hypothetical protein
MPTNLPPVLTQTPMVDAQTLRVSRPWLGWFEASYLRQGGEFSATNTELSGGVAGNSDHIDQVEDDLAQTSSSLAQLEAEVTTLQGVVVEQGAALTALETRVTTLETDLTALTTRVTTLETTVTDQGTRLAALEAWYTAVQAGLPAALTNNTGGTADSTVAALVALTATATVTALRDEINSALLPVLRNNYADLTVESNALRSALAA